MSQPIQTDAGLYLGGTKSRFIQPSSTPHAAPLLNVSKGGDNTSLIADFSNAQVFDFFDLQTYSDESLTMLVQEATQAPVVPVTEWVFTIAPLDPATQYWFRVRVSADGGSTYGPWSNTATATTDP